MRRHDSLSLFAGLILLFAVISGCTPKQAAPFPEDVGTTCIQGTAFYISPVDGNEVPYPNAAVGAWIHGKEQGLAEARTDATGNFCIDVPMGDFRVDVRVWGVIRLDRTTYTCKGSVDNVALGQAPGMCGKGGCLTIKISTDCKEFSPLRRRY